MRSVTTAPIDRAEARTRAREILSQGRFHYRRFTPKPRHRSWIDRHLASPVARALRTVGRLVFSRPGLIVMAMMVVVVTPSSQTCFLKILVCPMWKPLSLGYIIRASVAPKKLPPLPVQFWINPNMVILSPPILS